MAPVFTPPDLSDDFFTRWVLACERLRIDPIDAIRVAYSESGCRAGAHNPNGNASGIIQFMPDTLTGLGWRKGHEAFRMLPAEEQVPFFEKYFRPYTAWCLSDALCYVAVFLPALGPKAFASGPGFVLCGKDGPLAWAYTANTVLDRLQASGAQGKDGSITVADLGEQLRLSCRGARWDAILGRLRQTMGLQAPEIPEAPSTEPRLPDLAAGFGPEEDTTQERSSLGTAATEPLLVIHPKVPLGRPGLDDED